MAMEAEHEGSTWSVSVVEEAKVLTPEALTEEYFGK